MVMAISAISVVSQVTYRPSMTRSIFKLCIILLVRDETSYTTFNRLINSISSFNILSMLGTSALLKRTKGTVLFYFVKYALFRYGL